MAFIIMSESWYGKPVAVFRTLESAKDYKDDNKFKTILNPNVKIPDDINEVYIVLSKKKFNENYYLYRLPNLFLSEKEAISDMNKANERKEFHCIVTKVTVN